MLLLLLACADDVEETGKQDGGIVVVGAGMAGLTAARVLTDAGHDVTVLEARDRIGGRVETESIGAGRFDVGAAWLHGIDGNPVASFADANGLTYVKDDLPWDYVYDEATGALGDPAWDGMDSAYDGFLSALPGLQASLGDSASVADARDRWVVDQGLSGLQERLGRFVVDQWIEELEYAGPVDQASLTWCWAEESLGGGDHFPVGGYTGYAEALAEGVDVRLSHPVTAIRWGDDGVEVDAGETFTGSDVIVTVPVGVLRAGTISFEPPLSAARLAALDRLDMGNLEKVVLTWDTPWWDGGGFEFVSEAADGRFPEWYDVSTLVGTPALVGLYGGRFAREVQATWTDEEIVDGALAVLEQVHGGAIPAPAATGVTHWTNDPYTLGSYTFLPVGASRDDVEALAEPEGEHLLFAGEGTDWDYYGNVHAAVRSGLREARRLGVKTPSTPGFEGY